MKKKSGIRLQAIKDILRLNRYGLVDYSIKDNKKHPVAIIIPGGAYALVSSFVSGKPIAEKLNELGISCFILYYRVRRKAQYPNPQEDLVRAIKYLLEKADELNLDMENYSIWGSSAGGHLAGTFGTDVIGYPKYNLPKPKMIELTYPVISMDPNISHYETRKYMLGKDTSKEELLSIEKQVTSNFPSTFIWCGTDDKVVSIENTHIMVNALKENGVKYEFYEFEGVGHSVGVGEGTNAEGWIEKAVSFWKSL